MQLVPSADIASEIRHNAALGTALSSVLILSTALAAVQLAVAGNQLLSASRASAVILVSFIFFAGTAWVFARRVCSIALAVEATPEGSKHQFQVRLALATKVLGAKREGSSSELVVSPDPVLSQKRWGRFHRATLGRRSFLVHEEFIESLIQTSSAA